MPPLLKFASGLEGSAAVSRCFFLALWLLSAGTVCSQSTVTDVGSRNIVKLAADPARSLIYGLNQAPAGQNSSVVAFDASTGAIANEVTIAGGPTDFDLSARTDAIYVIHSSSRITRIDLQSFSVNATRQLATLPKYEEWVPFDIAAGRPGIVYFTDGAWAPVVYAYDFENSRQLATFNDDDGVGDLAVSRDGNSLYTWRQYGWTAGVINTHLRRSEISGDTPQSRDVSQSYGEREPFDAPILLDLAEERIFHKSRVHDRADLKRVLTTFPEVIYGITLHGELAFGTSKVFNGRSGEQVGTMPFPTTILTVSGDQKRLFVYSSSTRKLASVPLSQYGEVSGPGMIPAPRDHEAVSAGLAQLEWSGLPVATRYQVYFGSDSNQVRNATSASPSFLGSTVSNSIALPNPVTAQGTYFWRVDVVSVAGTNAGPVWQFQIAPIFVLPKKVSLVAIAGSSPLPTQIEVRTNGTVSAWTAAESIPWASATPSNGTGNASVSLKLELSGVNPGLYTNSLSFTSGSYEFVVPIELRVIPLEITKMAADLERPYIYALQGPSGGSSQAHLLFINTQTEQIEKAIALGSNLQDLDISHAEGRLYIADWGHDVTHVIDLSTQTPLPPLHLGGDVYKINAGRPGRIYTEGLDQWINLSAHDSLTGTLVSRAWVREGDGEVDPTGEYYYHSDNNISNAHIQKYRVTNDAFEQVKASLQHPYGSRNLLMSGDGSRLFWRGFVYDADLNELGSLNEEIHATTLRGELAFGASQVFNSVNGNVLTNLSFASTVKAVSGDQAKLFAYDAAAKQLRVIPLSTIAPVQGSDLVPVPGLRETISLPLGELSWSTSPFALRYKVYFGTNEAAVAAATDASAQFLGTTDRPSLALNRILEPGRQYYWRVDSVGFATTVKGKVWEFTTFPVTLAPKSLAIQAVAGAPLPKRTIEISGGSGWTISEDSPWFSVAQTPGSATLQITTNLPPGSYTNEFAVSAGGLTLKVPVTLQVFKMTLTKMLADLERPYVYGLHPGSGTFEDAFVVFINTVSGEIENVLPIGSNPTDFAINYFEDRLYVSNWQRNRTRVIDLAKQTEVPSLELGQDVYKINATRSGRIVTEGQDQWVAMTMFDSLTGTQVAVANVREGDGEGDPTGAFYYHCDNNSSGATIQKYRVSNNQFEQVAASANHGYGSRNLVMSGDGSRLFWQGYIYDADLQELGALSDEIYAVTRNGQFAFSSTKVYDVATRQPNYTLPFTSTVIAVAGSQDRAFLYRPSDGTIHTLELRAITNRPPTAENIVANTDEDTPVLVVPTITDPDGDAVALKVVEPPTNGSLALRPSGWLFTPATNFAGTASFQFYVHDRWRTSLTAVATINVRPVNDPPVVTNFTVQAVAGLARAITLRATDPDGDPLSFNVVQGPLRGSLSGTAPNLVYRPEPGYLGLDQFDYYVGDGGTLALRGVVTIEVVEPVCVETPAGLVNWWRGEGSLDDAIGGMPLLATEPAYVAGAVGQGFAAGGLATLLAERNSEFASESGFTLEAWIKRGPTNSLRAGIQWLGTGPYLTLASNRLSLTVLPNGTSGSEVLSSSELSSNNFHHVALTFDRAAGRYVVYVNGEPTIDRQQPGLFNQGLGRLRIGAETQDGVGLEIDEISTYSRPLTREEIVAMVQAGSKGKCVAEFKPSFAGGATIRQLVEGQTLELLKPARGTGPISYQWRLNDLALPGQTNATLVLTNFMPNQRGVYSVTASNSLGTARDAGTYVDVRAGNPLVNGGFEQGTNGWLVSEIDRPFVPVRTRASGYRPSSLFFAVSPTEGFFALTHGFDGAGPGAIRVAQDVTIPASQTLLTFDYRAGWNLRQAAYDHFVYVVIEPAGGGLPLDFHTVLRAQAGTYVADTSSKTGTIDLSAYAGRTVRISFDAEIPEANRGPGLFQLDNVALVGGTAPKFAGRAHRVALVEGSTTTLLPQVQGAPPMRYQWWLEGQALPGATNQWLGINGEGRYTLTASNMFGGAASAPMTVEMVREMEFAAPYLADGALWLPFGALAGENYVVEASTDLQTWTDAGSPVFVDSSWAAFTTLHEPRRFFRLNKLWTTHGSGGVIVTTPFPDGGGVIQEGEAAIP